MMAAPFLDSNILIYAASDDSRASIAQGLVQQRFIINVQGLNEFVNVARRKLAMPWPDVQEISTIYAKIADAVVPLDHDMHLAAIDVSQRYGFAFYDAVMLAAALKAGSTVFYSEDMQAGQVLDGGLQIVNPFRD